MSYYPSYSINVPLLVMLSQCIHLNCHSLCSLMFPKSIVPTSTVSSSLVIPSQFVLDLLYQLSTTRFMFCETEGMHYMRL